jgi:purine-binding chemotaxis protein CheW
MQQTIAKLQPVRDLAGEEHLLSLCSLRIGEQWFGIDTSQIREVLGKCVVERVPLAPHYIGGVVPYRGDVLTAVQARALLGLEPLTGAACVLVLDADPEDRNSERFGLIVDSVGGVATVDERRRAPNPSTLGEAGKALFCGAFRIEDGLLVALDPQRLNPIRLASSGAFVSATETGRTDGICEEKRCEP